MARWISGVVLGKGAGDSPGALNEKVSGIELAAGQERSPRVRLVSDVDE